MEHLEKLRNLGIYATHSGKYVCPECQKTNRQNKDDKSLSITFNDDSILYKCHYVNCKFNDGGVIHFNNKYSAYPAIKREYRKPKPVTCNPKDKLYEYFKNRAISSSIVDKYKVDTCSRYWDIDGKKTEKQSIVFNYFKNKELVNIKYRANVHKTNKETGEINTKKYFSQEDNTEKTFYGMDEVPMDTKELLILEGEVEVLSLAEIGIYAVSVPQGAEEKKLECIENCWEFLERFNSYIIMADDDDAGRKLTQTLLQRLPKIKCKLVNWSEFKHNTKEFKGKDANDLLMFDKSALELFISQAKYIPLENIYNTDISSESVSRMLSFQENRYSDGMSTGWKNLDDLFIIKTKRLMVVTGLSGSGKSHWVDNLLYNLTKKYELKHLICSFESTFEEHLCEYFEMHSEKWFSHRKKDCETKENTMTKQDIVNSMDYFSNYIYKFETEYVPTVREILDVAEQAIYRYGINTLTIDPYNNLNHELVKYSGREDQYLMSMLTDVRNFAIKHDILVIFVAHPKTLDTKSKIEMPHLRDISGGNTWWQKCDYGVIVHRDRDKETLELTTETKIMVEKVKNRSLGSPGGGGALLYFNYKKHKLLETEF